jgi:hypothetical protein
MKPELDYKEYEMHLTDDERAWIKQFNLEYYKAPSNADKRIIVDEEGQKEAHRVHNGIFTDVYSLAERSGALSELSPDQERFMQESSDEWDWMNVYKEQGYEAAIKEIFHQAERDVQNKLIPIIITLARFLNKYLALKKVNNRRGDNK